MVVKIGILLADKCGKSQSAKQNQNGSVGFVFRGLYTEGKGNEEENDRLGCFEQTVFLYRGGFVCISDLPE